LSKFPFKFARLVPRFAMTRSETLLGLLDKINMRTAVVGIFGAGYVGLPLACAFADTRFRTVAIDNDSNKISAIKRGDHILRMITSEKCSRG